MRQRVGRVVEAGVLLGVANSVGESYASTMAIATPLPPLPLAERQACKRRAAAPACSRRCRRSGGVRRVQGRRVLGVGLLAPRRRARLRVAETGRGRWLGPGCSTRPRPDAAGRESRGIDVLVDADCAGDRSRDRGRDRQVPWWPGGPVPVTLYKERLVENALSICCCATGGHVQPVARHGTTEKPSDRSQASAACTSACGRGVAASHWASVR